MKNYLLSLAALATASLLAGCGLVPQPVPQEEVLTHTGQQEENGSFTDSQLASGEEELPLSGSYQATGSGTVQEAGTLKEEQEDAWIPKGYTGAIALITEANSGDIITQTGDQLLYRNEVYGFQVLLGFEWVDGQIGIGVQKQHVTVYFTLPDDGIGSFNGPLATMNPRAYTIFRLFIKSKSEYEKYSDRSYYDFIGCNNKYCFLGGKDPGMNNYYTKRYSKVKRESGDFVDSVYQAIGTFSIQE
ncbi:MAG: hypothetical protein ACFN4U_03630 [Candidatus Absconditicoccaceae bacterium]